MNVLFDYSVFFHQKYGGVTRYFLNLYNEFIKENINIKIIAPIHNNIFLNNYVKANSGNNYLTALLWEKRLWTTLVIARISYSGRR